MMKSLDNDVKRVIVGIIAIGIVILINVYSPRYDSIFLLPVIIIWIALTKFKKTKEFFNDWFLPFWLFLFYESFRSVAFKLGNTIFGTEPIIHGLIKVESTLFFFLDEVPPVWIQGILPNELFQPNWFASVLFFFYGMFFWLFIVVAFILWKKRRDLYYRFVYGLVGLAIFDTFIFLFFPSGPPWYAAQQGVLPPLEKLLWTTNQIFTSGSTFYNDNLFAAFPSHHAAWPFLTVLFLIKAFGKKMIPLMIVPIVIIFGTWYGAEHYVIDSIAGVIVAYAAYYISLNWEKIGRFCHLRA